MPTFLQPYFFVVYFVLKLDHVYPCPPIDEFDAEAYCLKEICRSLCTLVIDIKICLHTEN